MLLSALLLLLPALLGLSTALGIATPARQHRRPRHHTRGGAATAARGDEFSLAMSVNGTYLALVAVSNGTAGLVLQAQVLGRSPGTPAYVNTTSDATGAYDTSLVLVLGNDTAGAAGCEPGAYGLSVPDLGDLYGFSENVVAVRGYQEFEFEVDDGTVFHELTSASQSWFACEDAVVGGAPGYFLRWGVFTEGSAAPEGCGVTSVVQDYNIAVGARAAGAW